jgi:hypothetical protein
MQLEKYIHWIEELPASGKLTKEQLLVEKTRLGHEGGLAVHYAPHNETVNTSAEIVIVGITPGWTQMELAYRSVRDDLHEGGYSLEQMAMRAKRVAGLAGSMRQSVVAMLDQLGLPELIGLRSAAELFGDRRALLHTTSVLQHPVFVHGVNYTGHQPTIERSELLSYYAYEVFPKEAALLRKPRLWIPLGKAVSEVMQRLVKDGVLKEASCLFGFPHPSGANGHRHRQFEEHRDRFTSQLRQAWKA